jgi:lysophospholipase L1-like esterase
MNPGRITSVRRPGFNMGFAAVAMMALLLCAVSAQAKTIRIVVFGDSATYGYLVARNDAFPAQLEHALRARGYDVTVANEGVNGDTTAGALRRFDDAIGPRTDIAIVEFGTNDLRLRVPRKRVDANLTAIIKSLKARRVEVIVAGLGSLDLSAVARATGVPYAQWTLSPGRYRARDHAHFNAAGYRIIVSRMMPLVEAAIARRR